MTRRALAVWRYSCGRGAPVRRIQHGERRAARLQPALYLYTSQTGNNGSAFAGITVGLAMLIGRYFIIVPMMAVAGSLVAKKIVPASASPGATRRAVANIEDLLKISNEEGRPAAGSYLFSQTESWEAATLLMRSGLGKAEMELGGEDSPLLTQSRYVYSCISRRLHADSRPLTNLSPAVENYAFVKDTDDRCVHGPPGRPDLTRLSKSRRGQKSYKRGGYDTGAGV